MEGRSRLLILVGSPSTGKTRARWEAVQPPAGAPEPLRRHHHSTPAARAVLDARRLGVGMYRPRSS
ncbi:hypothetical protein [Streptomyces sp. SS8]